MNTPERAGTSPDVRLVRRPLSHRPWSLITPDLALAFSPVFLLAGAVLGGLGWGLLPSQHQALVAPLAALGGLLAVVVAAGLYQRAVARSYAAQWRSVLPRTGYLVEDAWPEPPLVAGVLASQILRGGNPDCPIPSLAPTDEQASFYNLVKWPIALPRLLRTYLIHLPWCALRGLVHKLSRGTWSSVITDDDVIQFIEGTSGIVFSELLEDGRTLRGDPHLARSEPGGCTREAWWSWGE